MKTGRPPILETRCLAVMQMPMAYYYILCNGTMRVRDMAKLLGVSPGTIYNWMARERLEWITPDDNNRASCFIWRGFYGNRKQHCERHGVTYSAVRKISQVHGLPFADSLEIAIGRKDRRKSGDMCSKREMARLGISNSNVYKIRKEYGTSVRDAVDIALARKATREARNG